MKAAPKITRVKLKINQKHEFILFGIVSPEPDYKISLALNRKLKISLKNISPVILNSGSGNELSFSRFSDSAASPDLIYDLISNRSGKNYLLKKLKNIDYIFRIYNPEDEVNIDQILSLLRETECLSAVFTLDPDTIKDKNLLHLTS